MTTRGRQPHRRSGSSVNMPRSRSATRNGFKLRQGLSSDVALGDLDAVVDHDGIQSQTVSLNMIPGRVYLPLVLKSQ